MCEWKEKSVALCCVALLLGSLSKEHNQWATCILSFPFDALLVSFLVVQFSFGVMFETYLTPFINSMRLKLLIWFMSNVRVTRNSHWYTLHFFFFPFWAWSVPPHSWTKIRNFVMVFPSLPPTPVMCTSHSASCTYVTSISLYIVPLVFASFTSCYTHQADNTTIQPHTDTLTAHTQHTHTHTHTHTHLKIIYFS